jgi:hypothetical protein
LAAELFFLSISAESVPPNSVTISSLGLAPIIGVSMRISGFHVRLQSGYNYGLSNTFQTPIGELDIPYSHIPVSLNAGYSFGAIGLNFQVDYLIVTVNSGSASGFAAQVGLQYDLFYKDKFLIDSPETSKATKKKRPKRKKRARQPKGN